MRGRREGEREGKVRGRREGGYVVRVIVMPTCLIFIIHFISTAIHMKTSHEQPHISPTTQSMYPTQVLLTDKC